METWASPVEVRACHQDDVVHVDVEEVAFALGYTSRHWGGIEHTAGPVEDTVQVACEKSRKQILLFNLHSS